MPHRVLQWHDDGLRTDGAGDGFGDGPRMCGGAGVRVCGCATNASSATLAPAQQLTHLYDATVRARLSHCRLRLIDELPSLGVWERSVLARLMSSGDAPLSVNSLCRDLGVSRQAFYNRWRQSVFQVTVRHPKFLIDWCVLLRVATARHDGASWCEAASVARISLRSLWRLAARVSTGRLLQREPEAGIVLADLVRTLTSNPKHFGKAEERTTDRA
jgi:hypothetical protein